MTISTAFVLVAAILGGVSTLLAGASLILHALAPHTKTKLDDKAAADIDKLKTDVDKLTKLLPINPSNAKQSGRVRLTMLAVLALAAVAACSLSMSCTAAQKKAVSDFGHCEETAAVKDLEGPIKSIGDQFIAGKLTKDSALALLDSFGVSYGLDTVGCAVTFVEQAFGAKVSGSADTGAATDLYNEWLSKHGEQALADESFREAERNFAEAEKGIDKATARINRMRAELAAAAPCDSGALSIGIDGNLTCANGLTDVTPGSYVPAVVACPVDNMPGSVSSSDIPCNSTITLAAPTGTP